MINLKQFKENLETLLIGSQIGDGYFQITRVVEVEGEVFKVKKAKVIFSRGKKKLGFNLKMEFEFKGLKQLEGTEGSFKYSEFSDDGEIEVLNF